MPFKSLLLSLLFAALLIACGARSDEDAVRDVVEEFFAALSENSIGAFLLLAEECRNEISPDEFQANMAQLGTFFVGNEIEVDNVEITERLEDEIVVDLDLALVLEGEASDFGEAGLGRARFAKEDGRWRFSDCAVFGAEETVAPTPTPLSAKASAQRAEADDDSALPGDFVDLPAIYGGPYPDTASHTRQEIDYLAQGNSNPPAGGPHWGNSRCTFEPEVSPPNCGPAPWGVHRTPWQPETLVHNMEHGGVIVWYNTTDQQVIDELEELAAKRGASGALLILAPYVDMEPEQIAITAWSRIDAFPVSEYSLDRIERFIDAHELRFNPEAF